HHCADERVEDENVHREGLLSSPDHRDSPNEQVSSPVCAGRQGLLFGRSSIVAGVSRILSAWAQALRRWRLLAPAWLCMVRDERCETGGLTGINEIPSLRADATAPAGARLARCAEQNSRLLEQAFPFFNTTYAESIHRSDHP